MQVGRSRKKKPVDEREDDANEEHQPLISGNNRIVHESLAMCGLSAFVRDHCLPIKAIQEQLQPRHYFLVDSRTVETPLHGSEQVRLPVGSTRRNIR